MGEVGELIPGRYSFHWSDPEEGWVEVRELDTFLARLKALCKEYGIGFELDSYDSGGEKLVIVPYDEMDWDIITADLSDYDRGIPFLDKAKEQAAALRAARNAKLEAEEAERREGRERAELARLMAKYGE